MISILLGRINSKVKFYLMINGHFVNQFPFVTFLIWVLVHLIGIWHLGRKNIFRRRHKYIYLNLDVCLIQTYNRTGNSSKILKVLYFQFYDTTSVQIRETMKNYNTPVIDHLVLYYNIKLLIFGMLDVVVYCLLK